MLAALFAGEALIATTLLDTDARIPRGAWLAELILNQGSAAARFCIAFSALFATFAFLRYQPALKSNSAAAAGARFGSGLLAAHFGSLGLFAVTSLSVFGNHLPKVNPNLAGAAWIAAAAAAILLAALAFLPWKFWSGLVRATGFLWLTAGAAAALTLAATSAFRSLWKPASAVTFQLVRLLLRLFVRSIEVQPQQMRIGTHGFFVEIAPSCSGLEGIGLLLVFGLMWLILFRREARLPQALVLLPLGVVSLFLLNAFRITALILIGAAGAPDVAAGGFHSQAGWIAFNSVAFGSCILARRWRWISNVAPAPLLPEIAEATPDHTSAYLIPFLAILAVGMLSRAVSGGFEWLYPLRFLAALGVLWIFRRSYSNLDWKCGAPALAAGVAVFAVWIGADRFAGGKAMLEPAPLVNASAWVRDAWIGLRILGAVVTVPIAEELAFRGYLLRRLSLALTGASAGFDTVAFQSVTWFAILGSSILFGIMHGGRWLLAAFAGVVYAWLIRRTGRIGDAVVAHAVTNALLAACVLLFNQWQLW